MAAPTGPAVTETEAAQAPLPGPGQSGPQPAEQEPAPERPLRRRSRVRATQVHLDEVADDHLSELRKRAVLADVDLTASAVLRLALAELVERRGYDQIVRMFADDGGRLRRGRPPG